MEYKFSETNRCDYCGRIDDLVHFFYDCDIAKQFWNLFRGWWNSIYEADIFLDELDILLGIPNAYNDEMFHCLNFCILEGKWYIANEKYESAD